MKILKITEDDANSRLDRFLKKLFPRASRSLIYKLNRKSKIKVKWVWENSFKKRDNEYKLSSWEEVKIFLSDKDFLELSEEKKEINLKIEEKFNKKDIVYEDSYLLVVNKNPGLNVHPWDYKTKESNLIYQVRDYLWDKLDSLTFKPSLVHRLDRDTSGIVIIAKKKDILQKLVLDFKNHKKIEKVYYAIVLWKLEKSNWTINKPLKRIENAKAENKVQVSSDWKKAITHYKVLKEHKLKTKTWDIFLSELEIKIETWRMHQIRVHLSSIWNPILWDKNYSLKKLNSFFLKNFWLKRQALHSWKIKFFHYGREKELFLEARIKKDLKKFIKESLYKIHI